LVIFSGQNSPKDHGFIKLTMMLLVELKWCSFKYQWNLLFRKTCSFSNCNSTPQSWCH